MEIRQLKYFVAVARENSFSKAASRIYVAQSALSNQIAQLEVELGVRLLHRTNRGTALTAAGETFLLYATSVLKQLEDAQASVKQPFGAPKGKVSVGIPPSVCNALAVPLLRASRAQLPGVDLELSEEATGQLLDRLNAGMLNMAILFDDGQLEGLAVRPLLDERLYLLCKASVDSKEKGLGAPISLREALQKPLFLASAKNGVRRIIERTARNHSLPPPTVVSDINSVSILRATVLAGIGSTILPPMAVKDELEAGFVYGRPIVDPPLKRRVVLCRVQGIPATPASQAVAHTIAGIAQDLLSTQEWIETSGMEKLTANRMTDADVSMEW